MCNKADKKQAIMCHIDNQPPRCGQTEIRWIETAESVGFRCFGFAVSPRVKAVKLKKSRTKFLNKVINFAQLCK